MPNQNKQQKSLRQKVINDLIEDAFTLNNGDLLFNPRDKEYAKTVCYLINRDIYDLKNKEVERKKSKDKLVELPNGNLKSETYSFDPDIMIDVNNMSVSSRRFLFDDLTKRIEKRSNERKNLTLLNKKMGLILNWFDENNIKKPRKYADMTLEEIKYTEDLVKKHYINPEINKILEKIKNNVSPKSDKYTPEKKGFTEKDQDSSISGGAPENEKDQGKDNTSREENNDGENKQNSKPQVEYNENRTVSIDGKNYPSLTKQQYYIVKVLDKNPEGKKQRWVIGRALEKIEKIYPDKKITKHKTIRDYFINRNRYDLYKDYIYKEKGLYSLKKN